MSNRVKKIYFDPYLFFSIFLLATLGLFFLYSASNADLSIVLKQAAYVFIGFILMAWIRPSRLLLFNALAACFLIASAVLSKGHWAMWSILMVGLCNSIMFPTIFSLAIAKMGAFASHGSGVLCLAVVGGAVIPIFQGCLLYTSPSPRD